MRRIVNSLLALIFIQIVSAAAAAQGVPASPAEFGRAELAAAIAAAKLNLTIEFERDAALGKECYEVAAGGGKVVVRSGDDTGAMYGALEAAERIKNGDELRASGKPYLQQRGLNLFLTLPWDYDKNTADQDPAALADPARWWFHDDHYWRTLLDEMARARLNWLDLHGAYDLDSTRFPNFYAYFIQSEQFPEVGVDKNIKLKNLARLNQVIDWAHERGIAVSLMSYEAQFWTPQKPKVPYDASEKNLYEYTKEVVAKAIVNFPKLDAIGFRIGESGHGGEFFKCYEEAVKASGRDIPLYTRSWVTKKDKVVPLARASRDFTVEIKYNGEQWGPPYMVAGGRVPLWYSYSFEDYLSDSRFVPGAENTKKMWPGVQADSGSRWPDQPYKIVWQVRANGTHRIFPFYNPEWVRRTIGCMQVGTTSGYTVEPMNAYYPASPRYYLKDATNYPFKWIHERDWMYLMCWGRLGYDNNVKEAVFDKECQRFLGFDAGTFVHAWRAASQIIPIAFTSYAFGPDHRDHAPELEWGGDSQTFIEAEPFDEHSIISNQELYAVAATQGADGRSSQLNVAFKLHELAAIVESASVRWSEPFVRNIFSSNDAPMVEALMLRFLGYYYYSRFLYADELIRKESGLSPQALFREPRGIQLALHSWRDLGAQQLYKSFTDRLRMGTHNFTWNSELPKLEAESMHLGGIPDEGLAMMVMREDALESSSYQLTIDHSNVDFVTFRILRKNLSRDEPAPAKRAWILLKPLPSSTFFHKIPATEKDGYFEATVPYDSWGLCVSAEVEFNNMFNRRTVRRFPNWVEETPYKIIPAKPEPTPQIYSFEEALAHLDPTVLNPDKYGMLLIGPRAWAFHKHFDNRQKAKILDAVERGMDLLILQQDWASGRYPLDWLPDPPKVENYSSTKFDPDGALGLSKIETAEILYQHFTASPNWTIHGSGGVASRAYGKGNIYIVAARLMQRMHIPDCAKAIVQLLKHGRESAADAIKPVVVVDSCSEGPRYSNSFFQDMMNAQGIPFLTLGEVVAREQGMDSYKIIPGPVDPNRLLDGKGAAMVQQYYEKEFRAAAARPIPATRELFEVERARRKAELYKSLGLDPMPEKSPLNVKIVSTVQGDGWRMENILFESHPGFPVTGHLYIPAGENNKSVRYPAIVSVNGHWQHKTHESVEQLRNISFARHGYVVFAIDSPGHSFEGNAKIERRNAGSHDDYRLIVSSQNTTGIYVWDCIRAVDYLETRAEVDITKLGVTGVSGGGLTTLFAFAADDRYKCAVPVCYPTSFEMSPPVGCFCNHVPGFLQIGDRDSVLAIQAPKPVFVIGADYDYEFPWQGTNRTGEKLREAWRLFQADDRVKWKVYHSSHDYNKEMRQDALGFFDLYLRNIGDGAAVPEPDITILDPESADFFCMDPAAPGARTMRDLAVERLANAKIANPGARDIIHLNGGPVPDPGIQLESLGSRLSGGVAVEYLLIEVAPNLKIPAIRSTPGDSKGLILLISDAGKADPAIVALEKELLNLRIAVLRFDPPGIGELSGLDPRIFAYMGTAPAFAMARAMAPVTRAWGKGVVGVAGFGPVSSLAAMYTKILNANVRLVAGIGGLRNWSETFSTKVSWLAVQPRADHAPSIEQIQQMLGSNVIFTVAGAPVPADLAAQISGALLR